MEHVDRRTRGEQTRRRLAALLAGPQPGREAIATAAVDLTGTVERARWWQSRDELDPQIPVLADHIVRVGEAALGAEGRRGLALEVRRLALSFSERIAVALADSSWADRRFSESAMGDPEVCAVCGATVTPAHGVGKDAELVGSACVACGARMVTVARPVGSPTPALRLSRTDGALLRARCDAPGSLLAITARDAQGGAWHARALGSGEPGTVVDASISTPAGGPLRLSCGIVTDLTPTVVVVTL